MEKWWQMVQLVQLIWNKVMEGDPVVIASIISAVAIATLTIVTIRHVRYTRQLVRETRRARRDNPKLMAYPRESSQANLRFRRITEPSGALLSFDVLLVNPGAVPIVIKNAKEEVSEQESKEKVTTHPQFALPKGIRPELVGIYIFELPWVIPSDGFAVWSRYLLNLDIKENSKYVLTVKFDYSVGEKTKSKTAGPLPLTPWQGSGYRRITS